MITRLEMYLSTKTIIDRAEEKNEIVKCHYFPKKDDKNVDV